MLFLSRIVVLLRSDLDVHQIHLSLLNKRSSSAAALESEKIFSMGTVMELILASNYDVSYQQKKVVENVRV